MGTYAIAGNSGSAGKTTTVVTEAVLLAERGFTVRVIDVDPQANASTWLGHVDAPAPTVADVLRGHRSIADVERPARVILDIDEETGQPVYDDDETIPGVTVVPALRSTLDSLVVELASQPGAVLNLQDALRDASPVDVTLIDCPGSLNVLVTAGLLATAADDERGLITCVKPSGKEVEGIPALQQELANMRRIYKESIELVSVVPCAVPPQGAVYEEQLAALRDWLGDRVAPSIRRRAIVDEAYTNYVPLPLYGHRAKDVVADYNAVIDHQLAAGLLAKRSQVA